VPGYENDKGCVSGEIKVAIFRMRVPPARVLKLVPEQRGTGGLESSPSLTDEAMREGAATGAMPVAALTLDTGLLATGIVMSAASDTSTKPVRQWIILSFLLAFIGYGIGAAALSLGGAETTFVVSADWSAFGALFILALAVERALEPVSERLGPSTADAANERDKAQACAERAVLNLSQKGQQLAARPSDTKMETAETNAEKVATS
jgi:hypothetical protein